MADKFTAAERAILKDLDRAKFGAASDPAAAERHYRRCMELAGKGRSTEYIAKAMTGPAVYAAIGYALSMRWYRSALDLREIHLVQLDTIIKG
jgi:hypothetical protein